MAEAEIPVTIEMLEAAKRVTSVWMMGRADRENLFASIYRAMRKVEIEQTHVVNVERSFP
jgi:hypothetical protein